MTGCQQQTVYEEWLPSIYEEGVEVSRPYIICYKCLERWVEFYLYCFQVKISLKYMIDFEMRWAGKLSTELRK